MLWKIYLGFHPCGAAIPSPEEILLNKRPEPNEMPRYLVLANWTAIRISMVIRASFDESLMPHLSSKSNLTIHKN